MIHGPPEDKSMPGPRDDAPHGAKPGQRRRDRPPVRERCPLAEWSAHMGDLGARVRARKGRKPE